ncbi:MAG: hypothetical protein J7L77_01745 [Clostridiales bacterium]|nr:hypothetical protein [Clostridiales bacterium]
MKDNDLYYFALSAYLSKADSHYLEARLLWLNFAIDGACDLFWLAIEQLIKLNLIQHRIEEKSLQDVKIRENGNKIVYSYDPQETDFRKIHKILDKTSYEINSRHQLDKLLRLLIEETGIDLCTFRDTLEKVKEYYERRYYRAGSTSISLGLIDKIDEIYFYLRNSLNENFPRALIDEISYQRKFNTGHPLPYFAYAYLNNKHFKSRKHPVVNQMLPDGRIIYNDGCKDEICKDEIINNLL